MLLITPLHSSSAVDQVTTGTPAAPYIPTGDHRDWLMAVGQSGLVSRSISSRPIRIDLAAD